MFSLPLGDKGFHMKGPLYAPACEKLFHSRIITELEKIQDPFILRKHTLIPTCYQHGSHMKPERTRNRSGSPNTQKRPHATRAACVFREETRRKAIFLKQTEKVKQNFTKTAPSFSKKSGSGTATSRKPPSKTIFWRRGNYFLARFLYGPSGKCRWT